MVRAIIIKVLEKGRVVKEVHIGTKLLEQYLRLNTDLGTDWFGRLLAALFDGESRRIEVKDVNEANHTPWVNLCFSYGSCKGCFGSPNPGMNNSCSAYNIGLAGWIGIGTGTTAATRQDFKLEKQIDIQPVNAFYNDGSGLVILSGSFAVAQDVQISEIGLFLCTHVKSCGDPGDCFLLDRTVLDNPISVQANQTVYVEYRIAI